MVKGKVAVFRRAGSGLTLVRSDFPSTINWPCGCELFNLPVFEFTVFQNGGDGRTHHVIVKRIE